MNEVQPLTRAACQHAELLDVGVGTGKWLAARSDAPRRRAPGRCRPEPAARSRGPRQPVSPCTSPTSPISIPTVFPAVKVVVFDNVLEHLPSSEAAEGFFARTCAIASHVVHIRHPSFEHEDYLAAMGLKQYWTDWPGVHTAHIRLARIRRDGGTTTASTTSASAGSCAPRTRTTRRSCPRPHHRTSARPSAVRARTGPTTNRGTARSRRVVFDRPVYFAFDLFFFLRSDAPTVQYRVDTDDAVARAHLLWPGASEGRSRPRVKRLLRRARGA